MVATPTTDGDTIGKLGKISDAIAAMAAGRMVILVDDEDRENEGDLVVAASKVTAEHINFMCREGRGLICLAMVGEQVDKLGLSAMTDHNNAPLETAFTVSMDHRDCTGISASGRAHTIRAAVAADASAESFVTPGHVMPLRARSGGVLVRTGQTEGSVDLARLAGLEPAGVICEVMNPDGSMARLPELLAFGREHDMPVVTVADLIRYRLQHEPLVRCVSRATMPTDYGDFDVCCYEHTANGQVHVALVHGEISEDAPTLVRVHRADALSDAFGVDGVMSRSRLEWSFQRMAAAGAGVVLYLRSDPGDARLDERLSRMEGGVAEVESQMVSPGPGFHDFGVGAQILRDLGLRAIRVMTNTPQSFPGLSGYDLEIVDWVPIEGDPEA
ncbi:MAG: 3,4-dihydroxy-2-butanone-4-phosphate synthase [Myxococcota bacterium]